MSYRISLSWSPVQSDSIQLQHPWPVAARNSFSNCQRFSHHPVISLRHWMNHMANIGAGYNTRGRGSTSPREEGLKKPYLNPTHKRCWRRGDRETPTTTVPRQVRDNDTVELGSIVSGTVRSSRVPQVCVLVGLKRKGTIEMEQLADHKEQATMIQELLKRKSGPGYIFDKLLVLDINEDGSFILSAKSSLVKSAEQICADFSKIDLNSVVHKQTSCASTDPSFIQDYFLTDKKIAMLKGRISDAFDPNWEKEFSIGAVVTSDVTEVKDCGYVTCVGLNDVVGFVTNYQCGGLDRNKDPKKRLIGAKWNSVVIDFEVSRGWVNLTPQISKYKNLENAWKDLELGQKVDAVVEIIKKNYLVVSIDSIPKKNSTIGFAPVFYYNTQLFPRRNLVHRQRVVVTIMALPSPETLGRLLVHLNELTETSSAICAKKKSIDDIEA